MIVWTCACCQKELSVNDELTGKKVRCPVCKQVETVAQETTNRPASLIQPASPQRAQTMTLAPQAPAASQAPTLPPNDESRGGKESVAGAAGETGSGDGRKQSRSLPEGGPSQELYNFLAPAQEADELGRLGPFRVLQVLGAGGMGVVYRAEDPQLKRPVALKAMLPALVARESSRKRFLREAQAAAAIVHDHVVAILQVGEDRGVPFLAMEFLEGESLAARLKREQRLPVADVVRIGREIAEGLSAAHQRGLIHRDIKPANLWLEGERGRIKVLDFGLARAAAGDAQLTQRGAIVGTPAYMAPEQAGGKEVDTRCDLFSLGCVLYRLCTGTLPFKGKDAIATLIAVASHHPPPPTELCPDVPPALSDLVMQLLAKKPEERPASAEAVATALGDMAAVEPAPRQPAPRRLPVSWLVGGGVLGLAVLGLLLAFLLRPGAQPATEVPPSSMGSAQKVAPDESADPRLLATGLKPGRVLEDHDFRFPEGSQKYITKADDPTPYRVEIADDCIVMKLGIAGAMWWTPASWDGDFICQASGRVTGAPDGSWGIYLAGTPHTAAFKVMVRGDGQLEIGPTPWTKGFKAPRLTLTTSSEKIRPTDFNTLAVARQGHEVTIFLNGQRVPRSFTLEQSLGKCACGLMGTQLGQAGVRADCRRYTIWELPGAKSAPTPVQVSRFQPHAGGVRCVTFSIDGKQAISGGNDRLIRVSDVATGKLQCFMKGHTNDVVSLAVHPDGRHLVSGSTDRTIRVWDLTSGAEVRRFQDVSQPCWGLSISPDGTQVAGGSEAEGFRLWDFASGKVVDRFGGSWVNAVAFAPSGPLVMAGGQDGKPRLWDVKQKKVVRTFPGHKAWLRTVAFSGDGTLAVTCSGNSPEVVQPGDDWTVRLWAVATGAEVFSFKGHGHVVKGAVLSRDGRWILSGSNDRTIRLWDVANQKEQQRFSAASPTAAVAFSPDARYGLSGHNDGSMYLWRMRTDDEPAPVTNSLGMEFIRVPQGKAWLGGGGGTPGDQEVEITHDFYLGRYVVTQEEWQQVMGSNPSFFQNVPGVSKEDLKRFPVENISWNDTQVFLSKLNALEHQTGWRYRLPTEVEWEYACRGGPMTDKGVSSFHYYLEQPTNQLLPDQANCKETGLERTCKVGSFPPNRLRLYDMHGNVLQWCADELPPNFRDPPGTLRRRSISGSCWYQPAVLCKASRRGNGLPSYQWRDRGLRLVRVPNGKDKQ